MDIREPGGGLPVQRNGQTQARSLSGRAPTSAAPAAGHEAANVGATGYARSAELSELLSRLQQFPETRPEAIQAARQRLADGYYLSRSAAIQTAHAILEA
jgi:hypothetical protein